MASKLNSKKMKMVKCKFCDTLCNGVDNYAHHIETEHSEMMSPDMEPLQFVLYLKTGRAYGTCRYSGCHNHTKWNKVTGKYEAFCCEECKQKYVAEFQQRMINKHGKVTLLNDANHQRYMLSRRKISGVYLWSDRVHETPYTGSYERAFLEYLDLILDFSPTDIIGPSPHNFEYQYEGETHIYFPDFYIPSLNLEIEIKDGGDNPNNHHKIQAVDKVKEQLKDEVLRNNNKHFNYLKITNKNHYIFLQYLLTAKQQTYEGNENPIFII